MGAPAYQVTNLETCSPRQVALLVLGFFGLWATLYGLGASAPPLYVSQCSSSTRCADGVDGANLFSTGATPLYVSDPALCANKSACTRETCYLDRDGTLDWELQVAGLTSLNSFVLAAVGGCELYALLHAYVYLPVSWVGRDDGHDDDDDEL